MNRYPWRQKYGPYLICHNVSENGLFLINIGWRVAKGAGRIFVFSLWKKGKGYCSVTPIKNIPGNDLPGAIFSKTIVRRLSLGNVCQWGVHRLLNDAVADWTLLNAHNGVT